MKDTIYTIPLTDAFHSDDECPFCYIKRKLEQDAISFVLGCAYMEDDIRASTDQMGFCNQHYKKMYEYGNRLGMALILHTHYIAIQKELTKKINSFSSPKSSILTKFKKNKTINSLDQNSISNWANIQNHTCYVCNYIDKNFTRYMNTFFHLLETNSDFLHLFESSKGFCIMHFGELMNLGEHILSNKAKIDFYNTLFNQMQANLKRIEEDLSWFIDKYDYRNKDADWKTSKDAIPRAIQKLAGIYVQDEFFKEK